MAKDPHTHLSSSSPVRRTSTSANCTSSSSGARSAMLSTTLRCAATLASGPQSLSRLCKESGVAAARTTAATNAEPAPNSTQRPLPIAPRPPASDRHEGQSTAVLPRAVFHRPRQPSGRLLRPTSGQPGSALGRRAASWASPRRKGCGLPAPSSATPTTKPSASPDSGKSGGAAAVPRPPCPSPPPPLAVARATQRAATAAVRARRRWRGGDGGGEQGRKGTDRATG